jgi:hypothetical protein
MSNPSQSPLDIVMYRLFLLWQIRSKLATSYVPDLVLHEPGGHTVLCSTSAEMHGLQYCLPARPKPAQTARTKTSPQYHGSNKVTWYD